jgi:aspartyl/glutamyl-tRNA(Asn/Gln) amidotransferase C subunit
MKKTTTFTPLDVKHIAKLANIPVTLDEEKKLADGFNSVMKVIGELNQINVKDVEPTHQVTGLTNVTREDEVDENRMLTQSQALGNAKKTYNGFFMVDQILEE